ncbi:hypothetical protein SFR_3634 [Streptomyces sp. FR-008]|nr:hypothetical protein SFR_3634 [Streptomyces sp. FR-008]
MSERSERAVVIHRQGPIQEALPTGGWAVWLDQTGCTRNRRQARCGA